MLFSASSLRPCRAASGEVVLAAGELRRKLESASTADDAATEPVSEPLADEIVAAVRARNQMHVGGFLFHKLLGLPVVKRDMVYRQIHSLDEVTLLANDLDNAERDEVLADFTQRGTPVHLSWLKKLFYRHSAI